MGRSAVFFWLLLTAPLARASGPDVVELKVTGTEVEREQLAASVVELLSRLGLHVGGTGDLLASVGVTFTDTTCTVTVVDRRKAIAASRTIMKEQSAQLTVEAAAYIIQSTVEALADLERNPPSSKPPPTTVEVTPPPIVQVDQHPTANATTPPPSVGFDLGAMITGRSFGNVAPFAFGGGLLGSFRLLPGSKWAPRLSLALTYNAPFEGQSSVLQIATQTLSVRALPGVRLLGDDAWSLELHAGLGLDVFFTSGRSTSLTSDHYSHERADVSPLIIASVAAHHKLTSSTDLFLTVSGELDLLPHRFVSLGSDGSSETLYDAWRVRPTVALGFTFELAAGRGTP